MIVEGNISIVGRFTIVRCYHMSIVYTSRLSPAVYIITSKHHVYGSMAASSGLPVAFEHLTHLTSNPSVRATLVLAHATGSIIHSSGFPADSPPFDDAPSASLPARLGVDPDAETHERAARSGDLKSAREVATAVWTFFERAGTMVEEMMVTESNGAEKRSHEEEEIKLLRLRLRRMEFVIVPGRCDRVAERNRNSHVLKTPS